MKNVFKIKEAGKSLGKKGGLVGFRCEKLIIPAMIQE